MIDLTSAFLGLIVAGFLMIIILGVAVIWADLAYKIAKLRYGEKEK